MNSSHSPLLLKGMRVFSEQGIIESGYIKTSNQKIVEVGSLEMVPDESGFEVVELPPHFILLPGFIDVHIHGANGADVMDATEDALYTMATSLPREGTTSFLATTMTQSHEKIEKALKVAGEYIKNNQATDQAEILGIHLEGPFVNPSKAGAQPVEHMEHPNTELFKNWQALSKDTIKQVTLASELPGGLELIQYLSNHHIIASIGHSDATFEEVKQAVEAGSTQVTHLFNQMRGLHHREPGVAGAAFLLEELKAELIVDGIHVHPEMVKFAYQQKKKDGLILITDSMRAKCLKNGVYELGGQDVYVNDEMATLPDGTLAGSILETKRAVKNMITYTNCTLEDVVHMASINPAKQLNVYDRKGSITVGKDADFVILDRDLEVELTVCRGSIAFQRKE
jgi:N-acetylglucosamine-6-phosphate deacetylase